jgi:hypothetical protein
MWGLSVKYGISSYDQAVQFGTGYHRAFQLGTGYRAMSIGAVPLGLLHYFLLMADETADCAESRARVMI